MIGGNEANLALVGYEPEKVKQLAKLAHELGVLIHIDGMPFGDSTIELQRPTESGLSGGLGITPSYLRGR
jgi:hypothetical protein